MEMDKLVLSLTALDHLISECKEALRQGNQPDHVAYYLLGCLGILQDDLAFVMRTKGELPPTVEK